MVAVVLPSWPQITVSCYTVVRSVVLSSSRAMLGLLRKTVTPVCSGVQLPAALNAPHCTVAYNRGVEHQRTGVGYPSASALPYPVTSAVA